LGWGYLMPTPRLRYGPSGALDGDREVEWAAIISQSKASEDLGRMEFADDAAAVVFGDGVIRDLGCELTAKTVGLLHFAWVAQWVRRARMLVMQEDRSSLLHPTANPHGGITPAEVHLSTRKNCSDNRDHFN
jgi:hypothetical protein